MGIFKIKHTPQGERIPGFTALCYYLIGGLFALLFISLLSVGHLSSNIKRAFNAPQLLINLPEALGRIPYTKEDVIERFKLMVDEKHPLPRFNIFKIDSNQTLTKMRLLKNKVERKREKYYQELFAGLDNTLEAMNEQREKAYDFALLDWISALAKVVPPNFFKADVHYHSAVSTILFFIVVNILSIYLIASDSKLALINTNGLISGAFYKASLPFILLYVLSLIFLKTEAYPNIVNNSFVFVLPALLVFFPVYFMVLKESLKETDLYQEWFVEGRGQEVGRWGSFASYHRHDISREFRQSQKFISKKKESCFYIGKTKFLYDYKFGGRHIGTKSEQHLIIVAGTGAGKSRDILNNNTLTYSGGMIVFDTKGEHVEVSHEKRSAFAKTYVVDPWGKNKLGIPTDYWNPLETIDINSDTARARIERICQSVIIKEGGGAERAVDTHFREAPQKILRGYIAHVLSKFPEEQHNFPSIYNLMFKGSVEGKSLDPDAVDSIILDMGDNDVCEGAPIEAATILTRLQGSEESGVWSTLSRSLDWVNDPHIRKVMSKSGTFSLRECKLNDATVYLVVPENFLIQQRRFIRMFYQVAFDELDEHYTQQPEDSKRRVLFVFDEFEVLGHFESARQAALRGFWHNAPKRSIPEFQSHTVFPR